MPDNKDNENGLGSGNKSPVITNEDAKFASEYLSSLPMTSLVSERVNDIIASDIVGKIKYGQFVEQVGLNKDGSVKMVYAKIEVNGKKYVTQVPFISLLDTDYIAIDEANFSLDVELTTSKLETSKSNLQAGGSFDAEAKANFLFGSAGAKIHTEAKYSSDKERTHKQDSSSKVHFDFKMKRQSCSFGMQKLTDQLREASQALLETDLSKDQKTNKDEKAA